MMSNQGSCEAAVEQFVAASPLHFKINKGEHETEVRYVCEKPIPMAAHFYEGFHPLFEPKDVMKGQAKPRFTFMREFVRQLGQGVAFPEDVLRRWREDGQRFHPEAYRRGSLLWKGDQWRVPCAGERLCMHAFPTAALDGVKGKKDWKQREATRCSLVGNGFHLPSLLQSWRG